MKNKYFNYYFSMLVLSKLYQLKFCGILFDYTFTLVTLNHIFGQIAKVKKSADIKKIIFKGIFQKHPYKHLQRSKRTFSTTPMTHKDQTKQGTTS